MQKITCEELVNNFEKQCGHEHETKKEFVNAVKYKYTIAPVDNKSTIFTTGDSTKDFIVINWPKGLREVWI